MSAMKLYNKQHLRLPLRASIIYLHKYNYKGFSIADLKIIAN